MRLFCFRTIDIGSPQRQRSVALILAVAVLIVLVQSASGQGSVMVQPVLLELQPKPGERVSVPVSVRNMSATDVVTIEAMLWPLYQDQSGRFGVIDPEAYQGTPPAPPGKQCLPWTQIDADSFDIAPSGVRTVTVSFQVPSNVRGLYAGCLIVQTKPPDAGGIAIRIRFVVPILVQIYGRAMTRRVELKGAGMGFVPKSDPKPAGTVFGVLLRNSGESLAQLKGRITVYSELSGRSRKVTQVELPNRRLLPGVEAMLQVQTAHRLPKGKYRLVANMTMEGSRLPPLTMEVDYVGDPEVSSLTTDAELQVLPGTVEVDGPPGSTRSVLLTVRNEGTERISLSPSSAVPDALQGVAIGARRGDALACTTWLSFGENEVSIPAGQERKLRLQVAVPREQVDQPYYYARLLVNAHTADGTSIGQAESLLIVRNKAVEPTPMLVPSGRMTITRAEEDKFNFVTRFANTGTVHLDPVCKGTVSASASLQVLREFTAERQSGLILPLGTAVFNATVDFAGIAPGVYVVRFEAPFGTETATFTAPVRVTDTEDGKQVEVIELPETDGTTTNPPVKGGGPL